MISRLVIIQATGGSKRIKNKNILGLVGNKVNFKKGSFPYK
tara:strand:+ start:887 stop:1009 length:123 start_codon:yes stop_codon:yes gene_type:complete